MINGVIVTPLSTILDDRGKIMHIMKNTDSRFEKFGEVYCSTIYPGIVKGWHLHKQMTLNYVVIKGKIKFVLFDPRVGSSTFNQIDEYYLSDENYISVTVPPNVWNGFMGIGLNEAFVINFTDIPYDSNEITRLDPFANELIRYEWKVKSR